jgi:hypothetical protein
MKNVVSDWGSLVKKLIITIIISIILSTGCYSTKTDVVYPDVFVDDIQIDYLKYELIDPYEDFPKVPRGLKAVTIEPGEEITFVFDEIPRLFDAHEFKDGQRLGGASIIPRSNEITIFSPHKEGEYVFFVVSRFGYQSETRGIIFVLDIKEVLE